MVNMTVDLAGVTLDNPIIPASGTFGYGREFAEIYDIRCLGSISIKGTTAQERFGNPTPRIAETPSGVLNAVGLQNPGVERVVAEELPNLQKIYGKPVIANIGGFSVAEYVACAEKLTEAENVGILEVNISCPNVHGGGMGFGTSAHLAAEVTAAVKRVATKPVFVKLTPNVTDITEIARACEAAGANGLSLINTLVGMRLDLRRKRPILANRTGGLSGPAVFPVALAMVYRVYEAVQIPLIGMGGISNAADCVEMLLAGASAVQIGAANLTEPTICRDIVAALPGEMEKYGITNWMDMVGGAHI